MSVDLKDFNVDYDQIIGSFLDRLQATNHLNATEEGVEITKRQPHWMISHFQACVRADVDLRLRDFTPFTSWKEVKVGEGKVLTDSPNDETRFYSAMDNLVRLKCGVLATFGVASQAVLHVGRVAYCFFRGLASLFSGEFKKAAKDFGRVLIAPISFVALWGSAVMGIACPNAGRKCYAAWERVIHGAGANAPCFQPFSKNWHHLTNERDVANAI